MKFRLSSMVALVALLAVAAVTSAYMVPRSGRRIASTGFGPSISYGYARQPQFSPMMRRKVAVISAPANNNKNAAQKMLDFYCSLVWIARPDLFVYDRLARMAWDSLTKNLQKIEADNAPENVVNKALMEMQNDLAKLQSAYNDVTDTQRRMLAQNQQAEAAADELYRRAQYALSKGYEQSCKDALSRRQELLEGAKKLQADIKAQNETREKLYQAFQSLEEQFREKIAKRNDLMDRAKTAKTMTKINDMLNEFNNKRLSDDAFDNLERKVETMEAAASSFNWFGLAGKQKAPMTEDERLEMEFAQLEASAAVNKEMETMLKDQKTGRYTGSLSSEAQEQWLDQLLGTRNY